MGKTEQKIYFGGANTYTGYTSFFEDALKQADKRVYILKGSSGCGKSTLIKRVAERAKREGFSSELIMCSADCGSADGVVIPEKGIAVFDGTAPHILESVYPAARDSIVNLGEFWNAKKLSASRENLIDLIDKKSDAYRNAYRALAAAGRVEELRLSLVGVALQKNKMESIAARIARATMQKAVAETGEERVLMKSALNGNGIDTLPVYSYAQNIYPINDKHGVAHLLLEELRCHAAKCGLSRVLSYQPIDKTKLDTLYLPELDLLFTTDCVEGNKPINTARFIDRRKLAELRQKERACRKLHAALVESAREFFADASKLHAAIERIYIQAMDFARLTDFTNKLLAEIFA